MPVIPDGRRVKTPDGRGVVVSSDPHPEPTDSGYDRVYSVDLASGDDHRAYRDDEVEEIKGMTTTVRAEVLSDMEEWDYGATFEGADPAAIAAAVRYVMERTAALGVDVDIKIESRG